MARNPSQVENKARRGAPENKTAPAVAPAVPEQPVTLDAAMPASDAAPAAPTLTEAPTPVKPRTFGFLRPKES